MPEEWYDVVEATAGLLQGDLIFKCPILDWKPTPIQIQGQAELEQLKASLDILEADIIVLTQACDLEQKSVKNVVVCPHYSLPDIKSAWEDRLRAKAQNPTAKAWRDFCDDVRKGFVWNYAMLNHGEVAGKKIDHRVVDFHDIHTIPLVFLQNIATNRGQRFRLRPPYREHLSQAFARYFMRVGLPSSVDQAW